MEKPGSKRSTVYFDPDLYKALRLKAATTDRSLSEIVDEAVRQLLAKYAKISPQSESVGTSRPIHSSLSWSN